MPDHRTAKAPGAAVPEFRHLRHFIALRDRRSISAAAASLGISQPALSAFIARLEADLGAQLVIRTPRGIELTEAGQMFAALADEVVGRTAAALAAIRDLGRHAPGSVDLALPSTLAALIAVPLTETIRHSYPEAGFYVLEAGSNTIVDRVVAGDIDLGLAYHEGDCAAGIFAVPLLREPLFALAARDDWEGPADARGIAERPVTLAELAARPLVLPRASSAWRRTIDRVAQRESLRLAPAFEIDSLAAMVALVLRASAVGIAPHSAAFADAARGDIVLVPVSDPGMEVTSHVIRARGRPVSQLSLRVEDHLHEVLDEAIRRHGLRAVPVGRARPGPGATGADSR